MYSRDFPVEGTSCRLPQTIKEAYEKGVALRKLGSALRSRVRELDIFQKREYAYFYRKGKGDFCGPAKTLRVARLDNLNMSHKEKTYTLPKYMARKCPQPLEYWFQMLREEELNTNREIESPISPEQIKGPLDAEPFSCEYTNSGKSS